MSTAATETVDVPTDIRNSAIIKEWMSRVGQGRDLRIIISADNSATGVGKTTLAVVLCMMMDIWGWTPDKATLDPREFTVQYDQFRSLSAVLLDEAEAALDRRRSMSKENLAVGHDFATKRYRQIMGVLTLPSKDMMDARIADKLCDYWILVEEPGEARVYYLDENQFTGQVYYNHVETITWPILDGKPVFEAVEQKKHDRMTGQTQSRYIHRDEFEEAKKNFWNKATAKTTYDFVKAAYEVAKDDDVPEANLRQQDIGQIVGMHQSNVSKIVNTDQFEDFYKSYSGDFAEGMA